jgi:hypothetical protein
MPTLYEYALIADAVYGNADASNPSQARLDRLGWTCPRELAVYDASVFAGGALLSSGFQGRAFVSGDGKSAVIGYKGTRPTQMSDLVADVRLAMGFIPTQAKDALKHTVDWMHALRPRAVTITGHSLGGALAQVVGFLTGRDFVTFNAPGMRNNCRGLSSSQTGGPAKATGKGLNLRTGGSFAPIAALGVHIGDVEVFERTDPGHGIGIFVDYLRTSRDGRRVPF